MLLGHLLLFFLFESLGNAVGFLSHAHQSSSDLNQADQGHHTDSDLRPEIGTEVALTRRVIDLLRVVIKDAGYDQADDIRKSLTERDFSHNVAGLFCCVMIEAGNYLPAVAFFMSSSCSSTNAPALVEGSKLVGSANCSARDFLCSGDSATLASASDSFLTTSGGVPERTTIARNCGSATL